MFAELDKVIVGQSQAIELLMTSMLSGGHCLLMGVPGLAKTLMISTLARVMELSFSRIQFTPDLMPSDITGTDIIEEDRSTGRREFRFLRGPVFANIVLADEINRTPPKTQAALLQAMQEHHVTAGGTTHELPKPFFVLATQNPIEQEGTYPLPEAQLDRFMFMVKVDYPTLDEERKIISVTTSRQTQEVSPVITARDIIELQGVLRRIPVSEHVVNYAVKLVRATRPADETAPQFVKDYLSWGAGPRAGQYLVLAAKAKAMVSGRCAVDCNDIREAAGAVLRHRLMMNFSGEAEGLNTDAIIEMLIKSTPEPGPEDYA
jgi:MoxR-like ATPase